MIAVMTSAPSTRQWLSRRQSATVDGLLDAGLEALREGGFEAMSLRDVAARAGVTHTTAYTYFTSKEHLLAELNWRLLQAQPDPEPAVGATLSERLAEALRAPTTVLTAEPQLAAGLLLAMASSDPDIQRIRNAIGADLLARMTTALGADADPLVVDAALLLYSGAMLQAGLGYFGFDDVVARIASVAEMWDEGSTPSDRQRSADTT